MKAQTALTSKKKLLCRTHWEYISLWCVMNIDFHTLLGSNLGIFKGIVTLWFPSCIPISDSNTQGGVPGMYELLWRKEKGVAACLWVRKGLIKEVAFIEKDWHCRRKREIYLQTTFRLKLSWVFTLHYHLRQFLKINLNLSVYLLGPDGWFFFFYIILIFFLYFMFYMFILLYICACMYVYIACLEDIFFKIRKCNMNFEHIKIKLC